MNWGSWFETARKLWLRGLSEAQVECSSKTSNNGPFPSSRTSHFQNEGSAKSFLWKWVLFTWEWKIIFISITFSHSSSLSKGSGHFPSPQLVYNTEAEASGLREVCGATRAREPSGKTGNSRHCYVCSSNRSITQLYWYWISNAKIKKETDDRIWGTPATPNFHFSWSCDNNCARCQFYTLPSMRWDAASKSNVQDHIWLWKDSWLGCPAFE